MVMLSSLQMRTLFALTLLATIQPLFIYASSEPITEVHQAGYCAIRDQCGKQSIFGSQLPCPDNGPAKEPSDEVRKKLIDICGDDWREGPVCCEENQLDDLTSNLKRASAIISSCPACKANFFNLFCTFTCSPDQSLFINVTRTDMSTSKKEVVVELDYFVSDEYGSGFYDSCKDVKFSATNGYVMDFIGGGAKNYPAFLKFLGDKKPLGSPFQINYPRGVPSDIEQFDPKPKRCNDDDKSYRCACVDCPSVCAELPGVKDAESCVIGNIPCLSLTAMVIYSTFLVSLILGHLGWVIYKRQKESKRERQQLLTDSTISEDEDDGEFDQRSGLLDMPSRGYPINNFLHNMFSKLGTACASYPGITIFASSVVVLLLSVGWVNFAVETDPVRLWVSPTSEAALEKAFFDRNFGPFYRANQAFLVNDTESGEVLSYETLSWWFGVEDRVRELSINGHSLEDVCFKPTDEGCVVQSITGWFGNDFNMVDRTAWKDDLRSCAAQPVQQQCLPDFGQPLKKELLLGGWEGSEDVARAKAMIVTWVVNNYPEGSTELTWAMDWERSLQGLLAIVKEEANERGLRLSFSTEISLEEELNMNTDAKIVVISYIAMFIYASLALGSTKLALRTLLNTPSRALVESKFTLGIFGILIVVMSVSASVGFCSAMGIKVTLIIAEVIPFLVLAVGVDNIFLIVHEFERVNYRYPDESIEVRVGKALGRIGPSILLSATTETLAFALGATVQMPAVRNFAIYAAGAVFINALLQVTMFIAVLAVNEKRVEAGRMDCFPCVKLNNYQDCAPCVGDLRIQPNGRIARNGYGAEEEGFLERWIRRTYAPWLLKPKTKIIVGVFFLGIFAAGVSLLPEVELGLDQRIALPSDSYLIKYFDDVYDYLGTGPPAYFITKDYNATQISNQKHLCGRFGACDPLSVANILELERQRPEVSYIAEPAASWIDDYILWLNPELDTCCAVNRRGELCGPYDTACDVCFEDRDPGWNITLNGMPEGEEFLHYLQLWIHAPTGEECPLAGKAAYSNALAYDENAVTIKASHFRTSHTALSSQADFINAYNSARRIAEEMSRQTGSHIFPYSKFYIFFDQYSTIINLTHTLLLSALLAIFLVSSVLLGSLRTGLCITLVVGMIVVDIIGIMTLWGVSLNAVSLVNLVICVGIAVEFCSHIARAFMFPHSGILALAHSHKYRLRGCDARAWAALVGVGGSVFSGITITKLIGVSVLAWTKSKIFEIYYFRMWAALVIVAATHALVCLPVVLSVAGTGQGWLTGGKVGEGEGVEGDLRERSRYRSNYRVVDDEDDSEDEGEVGSFLS